MNRRELLRLGPLAAVGTTPARAAPPRPGQPVVWPEVALLDGTRWGAAQAQDKAVVVVFWSLTCPFCKRHNVHLEKLRLAARGRALAIITVVREKDTAAVRQHLSREGLGFAVTQEWTPMAAALTDRKGTPVTVVVGRDGRLRQVIPGEMFEEDVLELLALG